MAHRVVLIPGDGTGPELVDATRRVLEATGVEFDWDVDLVSGYEHTLLTNVARDPNVFSFSGCDTPDVGEHIAAGGFDAMIVSGWYLKTYWQATLACRRLGIRPGRCVRRASVAARTGPRLCGA